MGPYERDSKNTTQCGVNLRLAGPLQPGRLPWRRPASSSAVEDSQTFVHARGEATPPESVDRPPITRCKVHPGRRDGSTKGRSTRHGRLLQAQPRKNAICPSAPKRGGARPLPRDSRSRSAQSGGAGSRFCASPHNPCSDWALKKKHGRCHGMWIRRRECQESRGPASRLSHTVRPHSVWRGAGRASRQRVARSSRRGFSFFPSWQSSGRRDCSASTTLVCPFHTNQ
jgi:hypothetical protein